MKCEKYDECGREAYAQGVCVSHLNGWAPQKPAPRKRAARKPRARKAAASRSTTKTTEATGTTSEPDTEVTS